MVICPDCGFENIEGVDVCARCRQSLTNFRKRRLDAPLSKWLLRDRIRTLEPKQPVAVAPETPLRDVLNLLVDEHIGCALVIEGERLVGIFSERDALMRINTQAVEFGGRPISEFMTASPGTLEMDDKLAYAVHKMALGGYRHVPILSNGRPVGVISIRDILRQATQELKSAKTTGS